MSRKLRRDTSAAILLSIGQVCDRLGIGRSTFYKLANAGELKTAKVAGQVRVHVDDLDAYVDRIRSAA
jgi:excisionase family DNA binding protein